MAYVNILHGLTQSHAPATPSLKILILNLMPDRIKTERQFSKMLAHTTYNSTITFCIPQTHQFRHPEKGLYEKYVTFDQIRDQYYDALIVTGAAVDQLAFEKVDYWQELKEIIFWRHSHVKTSLFICWSAYAAGEIEHFFVGKKLEKKISGVYTVNGYTMPHSRYFTIPQQNVDHDNLLAGNELLGAVIVRDISSASLYVTGHFEYLTNTLREEYYRDLKHDPTTPIPVNYFSKDLQATNTWEKSAVHFYQNWLDGMFKPSFADFSSEQLFFKNFKTVKVNNTLQTKKG
ncbi:homoserine O-acetyltransferase/O-succinyltransferase family protein [Liquorilactobacillus oeni]|uniref:Homoserine O-acetyltransferase n=1 Tax=Liquorilactobacillus oeni DSM 19972 TaxID=1423777 RepID=A0A0R1MCH2_9LACO|nr:homoserine O-succinyltransferase [Liquorilactobacillus oeni]KRL05791.1 homoserine O-succinyltransferase [Liquorilactobacillus oeni DSM 19972]